MARVFRNRLAFLCVMVGAFTPRAALGEPQRATLSLTREGGATSCIDSARLQKEVDALAGVPVIVPSADIAIAVTISPAQRGYVARILLSGARTGERTLDDEGPGCEALDRALVVTIAILLDAGPAAPLEPPDPGPPAGPAIPSTPPSPPSPKPKRRRVYFDLPAVPEERPAPQPRPTESLFSVSAEAVYDVGTLVDDAGGFTLGAEAWIPHFGVGAALVVLPFDRLDLSAHDIDYSLIAARVELCSKPPFSLPFGIAICSGLAAGQRRATATGEDAAATTG
ncbi:MAG: hypothetical protein JNK04_20120, partial [Myxococcales bacterium]|nr:hypothetical protein [Myxococcales bacterium]